MRAGALYLASALVLTTCGCTETVRPLLGWMWNAPTGAATADYPLRGWVRNAPPATTRTGGPLTAWASKFPPVGRLRSGTGFFISSGGLFVTSAHVIAGCPRISIWPRRGGPFSGEIVALDHEADVALLSTGHPVATYADVGRAQLGAPRAGARTSTLGYGVITAEPRKPIIYEGTFLEMASTSADRPVLVIRSRLHAGNSGGPVVDTHQVVLGMVIGRSTDQPDHGLVVPSSEIRALLPEIGTSLALEPVHATDGTRSVDFLTAISALVQCTPGVDRRDDGP